MAQDLKSTLFPFVHLFLSYKGRFLKLRVTFVKPNEQHIEEEKRDFGKWVLRFNGGSEMGDFELVNLMMELKYEGAE